MHPRQEDTRTLAVGTQVADYQIIGVLGQGAFGITYLAIDNNLQIKVAIKEYFPREFSVRGSSKTVHPSGSMDDKEFFNWGRERFLSEARTLARLDHPNIVAVRRLLQANSTAYLVMDYCDGRPLDEIIESDGPLDLDALEKLLWPILDALEHVHMAGLIHRDIKPANIFIRADGTPVLLDFGAARNDISQHSRSVTSLATAGYAPIEQYDTHGNQGAWSDIYGLSATLYRALTGEKPPDAAGRVLKDSLVPLRSRMKGKLNDHILSAIDIGLEILPDNRPQSILEWRVLFGHKLTSDIISEEVFKENLPVNSNSKNSRDIPNPDALPVATKTKRNSFYIWIFLITVLVGYVVWFNQNSDSPLIVQNTAINPVGIADSGDISPINNMKTPDDVPKIPTDGNNTDSSTSTVAANNSHGECPSNQLVSTWSACKGTFVDASGNRYVGMFQNGSFEGMGTITFSGGDKYVGGFKGDKYHGVGKYFYRNGDVFEGKHIAGKREGFGVYKFASGSFAESIYVNDNETNPIKYHFANGDVYEGEVNLESGKWEGRGSFIWRDGSKFVGEYKNGKENGLGTWYNSDGKILKSGEWKDGEFVSTISGAAQANPSNFVDSPPSYARPSTAVASRQQDAETLRFCLSEAETANKKLPVKLDLVTTYSKASCIQTSQGVMFIANHNYTGQLPRDSSTANMQIELKKTLIKQWCSDSKLKAYLNSILVEYRYFDSSQRLGMVVTLSSRDCF